MARREILRATASFLLLFVRSPKQELRIIQALERRTAEQAACIRKLEAELAELPRGAPRRRCGATSEPDGASHPAR